MKLAESKKFERFLEIVPGLAAWLFIISPFVLSIFVPLYLGIFILCYSFFWLVKSLNISRHLFSGYVRMKRNMNINWLQLCEKTKDLKELEAAWQERYDKSKSRYDYEDLLFVQNLKGDSNKVKDWEEITHVMMFAVSRERLDILEPSIKSLLEANYPMDKVIVVMAAEARCKETFLPDYKVLEKKYAKEFKDFRYYLHEDKPTEVIGKGPNLTNAGRLFWEEFKAKLRPEDVLVTTLDADHIVHPEYMSRLSYAYAVDPNRDRKSYQPIPLLFNNIWDAPAANRIAAVSSSFWQIVEGMRPYRLRTFAAHTQSMEMLLKTDFWSVKTIVEDGHQYWRTYFALNGEHYMVPLFIPVYQDAVLGENLWIALKNQYLQKRRWAWGVSDFPYIMINFVRHKEIPLFERMLQIFRKFAGDFSWSTSSFFLAGAWIPLSLNKTFQDTVLAHNIATFSSGMLRFAWIGLVLNVWISMILMPTRPKKFGRHKNLEMILQWVLGPPYAIFLSSLPALDSQTRLMLGKKMEVFWITPKIRKEEPKHNFADKENSLKLD